jgi:hypothetical protein
VGGGGGGIVGCGGTASLGGGGQRVGEGSTFLGWRERKITVRAIFGPSQTTHKCSKIAQTSRLRPF